jgi:hypothetical protein
MIAGAACPIVLASGTKPSAIPKHTVATVQIHNTRESRRDVI